MKYVYLLVLLMCLAPCPTNGDNQSEKPQDKKATGNKTEFQFDGIWKPKGAILSGVFLPPPALEAITLTIEKEKYRVTVTGEDHDDTGTYQLDESVTPKRMTIKSKSGPNRGKTIFAIYEIKNENAMRVCYDLSGTAFPKDFKAPKGTQLYVVGYRRQTPEAGKDSSTSNPPKKRPGTKPDGN